MILDLKKWMIAEDYESDETVEIGLTEFESRLGSFPITEKSEFTLHLANQGNKRLTLSGETTVTLAIPCDRCLTEVPVRVPLSMEKTVPLAESEAEEVDSDEGFLDGSLLDTDRLIFHEILVNRPLKVLCRDDCKGLCPVCGTNLNERDCGCDRTVIDPRMAIFQDILQKQ